MTATADAWVAASMPGPPSAADERAELALLHQIAAGRTSAGIAV